MVVAGSAGGRSRRPVDAPGGWMGSWSRLNARPPQPSKSGREGPDDLRRRRSEIGVWAKAHVDGCTTGRYIRRFMAKRRKRSSKAKPRAQVAYFTEAEE